jgi:hypothetical protein
MSTWRWFTVKKLAAPMNIAVCGSGNRRTEEAGGQLNAVYALGKKDEDEESLKTSRTTRMIETTSRWDDKDE